MGIQVCGPDTAQPLKVEGEAPHTRGPGETSDSIRISEQCLHRLALSDPDKFNGDPESITPKGESKEAKPGYCKDVIKYCADLLDKRERLRQEFYRHPEGSDARTAISASFDPTSAEIFRLGITDEEVQNVNKAVTASTRRSGTSEIGKGISCLTLSGGISLITYFAAREEGGSYYLF